MSPPPDVASEAAETANSGWTNQFGMDFSAPSTTLQGVITTLYEIGCAIGALFTVAICEKVWRRYMIVMGGTIMMICSGYCIICKALV
jgi:MFS family permease